MVEKVVVFESHLISTLYPYAKEPPETLGLSKLENLRLGRGLTQNALD